MPETPILGIPVPDPDDSAAGPVDLRRALEVLELYLVGDWPNLTAQQRLQPAPPDGAIAWFGNTSRHELRRGGAWEHLSGASVVDAHLVRSPGQFIPGWRTTPISWSSTSFGTRAVQDMWTVTAPTKITIPRSGLYGVRVACPLIRFSGSGSGRVRLAVRVNGESKWRVADSRQTSTAAGDNYVSVTYEDNLASGDYLVIEAYHEVDTGLGTGNGPFARLAVVLRATT